MRRRQRYLRLHMTYDDATSEIGDERVVVVTENAENIPGHCRILKMINDIHRQFCFEYINIRNIANRMCVRRGIVSGARNSLRVQGSITKNAVKPWV